MAVISAFGVTQHSQISSLFFRNRIQCIALYQLHNSQALLNLHLGGRGGGGGSESMDRQGCAILALEVVPKNLIFA